MYYDCVHIHIHIYIYISVFRSVFRSVFIFVSVLMFVFVPVFMSVFMFRSVLRSVFMLLTTQKQKRKYVRVLYCVVWYSVRTRLLFLSPSPHLRPFNLLFWWIWWAWWNICLLCVYVCVLCPVWVLCLSSVLCPLSYVVRRLSFLFPFSVLSFSANF